MKWNKQFDYPTSTRALIDGKRHYDVGTDEKLPSVTTILQATQSDEKKASLAKWRRNVGENKAEFIKNDAAERGTIMHRILEGVMANTIIESGIRDHLDEIWGSEITVYYPGLYAGATDCVGVYDGQPAIIDFKQSNKMKRREWIEDYFVQLAAYAMAHNYVYDTKIQSGIILMCTKDNVFQKFEIKDKEFQRFSWEWLRRVDQFKNV